MIDLEPMWLALAKYQAFADADGHGESWREMCEERTEGHAFAAGALAKVVACWPPAWAALAVEAAMCEMEATTDAADPAFAWFAGLCVKAADAAAGDADYAIDRAIKLIEAAIKERENVPP